MGSEEGSDEGSDEGSEEDVVREGATPSDTSRVVVSAADSISMGCIVVVASRPPALSDHSVTCSSRDRWRAPCGACAVAGSMAAQERSPRAGGCAPPVVPVVPVVAVVAPRSASMCARSPAAAASSTPVGNAPTHARAASSASLHAWRGSDCRRGARDVAGVVARSVSSGTCAGAFGGVIGSIAIGRCGRAGAGASAET